MTLTRFTLRDVPEVMDWITLLHFVNNLGGDSRSWMVTHPDDAETLSWAKSERIPIILADIFDLMSNFNYNFVRSKSKTAPRKPKPYPRPGKNGSKHIGKKPIAIKDFWAWWNRKG
jgi:hypothetical protein